MKRKSAVAAMLLTLCMGAAMIGIAGCGGGGGSDSGSPTTSASDTSAKEETRVALSETQKLLDRYENFTLTATVTDENGSATGDAVTWSSSNPAVVTVTNGLVQATGVGEATVTASAGGAEATCAVTVEDSGAKPVLSLTAESVSVAVGGEFDVSGSVMYKRVEQTNAVITWTTADPEIASVDENGNVTGVAYGETTLTAAASWNGVDSSFLTVQIPVTVKEDVSVSLTGAAATIYLSATTIEGQTFTNTVTYTGSVLVSGSAENVDESKIGWVSSDPDVASVSGGVVTAGTEEGTAEITMTYDTGNEVYSSAPVTVTVMMPTLDKTEEILFWLDATEGEVGGQIGAEEVFGASSGKTITRIAEQSDTSADISDDAKWLSERDTGSESDRTFVLAVYNDEYAYFVSAVVSTKVVRTYEDLTKLQEYGGVQAVTTPAGKTYYNYSGYFVLGNDIVVQDSDPVLETGSIAGVGSQSELVAGNGFTGTFNGNGHTIYNLRTHHSGLLGDIGSGAVVKNVAFVNVKVTGNSDNSGAGVLGYTAYGADFENIFIDMTTSSARSGMIGRAMTGGTVRNTVIRFDMTAGYNTGALACWTPGSVAVENVYVIYTASTEEGNRKLIGENTPLLSGTVKEIDEEALADASFENLPAGWYVAEGGYPMFESSIGGVCVGNTELSGLEGGQSELQAWVYGADESVRLNLAVTWSSSDLEVVEVSSSGALSFKAEGEAVITVSYGKFSATCTVRVEKGETPLEDVTSDALDVESGSEKTLGEQIVAAGVSAGLFDAFTPTAVYFETDAETDYNANTGAESAFFAAYDTGDETARTKVLIVANGDTVLYRVKVFVVTKSISSYEELANLQGYTRVTQGQNSAGATYYSYGGYFVLAGNLVATGEEKAFAAPNMGSISSGGHTTDQAGFHGTFDGRGYTVKGFKFALGGVFGDVGKDAVIKNVAFVDCIANDVNYAAADTRVDGIGILAVNACGTFLVDNVFVFASVNSPNGGVLFGRSTHSGTISNTVVYGNATGGWNNGAISGWTVWKSKLENVYVIFDGNLTRVFGNTDTPAYADGSTITAIDAEEVAGTSFTGLNEEYWNIVEGQMPTFKSAAELG